ncbi:hypothetical protein F5Y12DRAFT_771647 [Xylaria sp. FL1777]|nr:hypothetical protein F5Y12DRAFT_771647 [Xylaria sp. FL1777]
MQDSVLNPNNAIRSSEITTQLSSSTLLAFSTKEPVVRATSPIPLGYSFVPKGDPYLTRNCRRQTQQSHQLVYAVVNDQKKHIGIRVPYHIHAAVLQSESTTRLARRQKVRKHDESLEKRFSEAIRKSFPRIPHEELRMLMRRATAKGEGRVGRTGTIGIAEKARLAVQAHIRHTKTNYEELLRSGCNRESARAQTSQRTFDLLREWGLVPTRKSIPKKPQKVIRDKMAFLKGATSLKAPRKSVRQDNAMLMGPSKNPPSLSAQALVDAATEQRKVQKRQRRQRR